MPASEELASSRFGRGTDFDVKTVMLLWEGSWGANCNITFQNGRVVAKAQFGLKQGTATPDLVSEKEERERDDAARQAKAEEMQRAEKQAIAEANAKAEEQRKAADEAAKWRKWTDTTGKFKVEAKFMGIIGGKVKLMKADETTQLVPIDKLSESDREWITERKRTGSR